MTRTLLLASAVCAMSAAVFLTPLQASPVSGLTAAQPLSQSMIEKAGYRRYCWRWNHICRARWVAGWRYRRCMVLHGC